jgi:hypothetical protein
VKKNYETPEITVTILKQDVLLGESVVDTKAGEASEWGWTLDSIWNKFI